MSSTPTLERRIGTVDADWVDIAPTVARSSRLTGARIVVAISGIRNALATGADEGIVIDTDDFRPVDELDRAAAEQADARWSD
ncbi:hypothetical protein [Microbacterium sp. LMC-P-041]|uniref:hypothetical protein n=1 Tax=Microbacterium sp. LMC-P-041 TaxID=3040293 RepID=UPI0025556005|nr:hypothetical protein [Microbacterium sp. LMC-P-041]